LYLRSGGLGESPGRRFVLYLQKAMKHSCILVNKMNNTLNGLSIYSYLKKDRR